MTEEVVIIEEDRQGITASFYLNKDIQLFVDDKDRVQKRDGILRGFDHTHYHVEITFGPKKGVIVSYLRSDVKRIELATQKNGGENGS